jgi:hypothetical protein
MFVRYGISEVNDCVKKVTTLVLQSQVSQDCIFSQSHVLCSDYSSHISLHATIFNIYIIHRKSNETTEWALTLKLAQHGEQSVRLERPVREPIGARHQVGTLAQHLGHFARHSEAGGYPPERGGAACDGGRGLRRRWPRLPQRCMYIFFNCRKPEPGPPIYTSLSRYRVRFSDHSRDVAKVGVGIVEDSYPQVTLDVGGTTAGSRIGLRPWLLPRTISEG